MTAKDKKRRPLPDAILVAVDFSPCSLRALEVALRWKPAGGELILLHVIDTDMARRVERFGIAGYEDALGMMRRQAQGKLAELVSRCPAGEFETMIADGVPFAEICKIARDLDCGLIVMGKYGTALELKDIFFGGTAEKVVRGAGQPVLCVP
jgi:nucleotide-binding universal stress UspA family protein